MEYVGLPPWPLGRSERSWQSSNRYVRNHRHLHHCFIDWTWTDSWQAFTSLFAASDADPGWSAARNFYHVTRHAGCGVPKMVHTISRGVHQTWSIPRVVVHTINCGAHLKWSTPRVVVHTINCGAHPKWSTPWGVVHTTSRGVHPKWSTPWGVVHTRSCSPIILPLLLRSIHFWSPPASISGSPPLKHPFLASLPTSKS